MERVRFVLINPTALEWRIGAGDQPRASCDFRFSMLSSLYVAAAMPPYVETAIVDEDLGPIDFAVDADVVGISFMTYNAPHTHEIADRFREEMGKPVVLGAYHPTFMPGASRAIWQDSPDRIGRSWTGRPMRRWASSRPRAAAATDAGSAPSPRFTTTGSGPARCPR